MTNEQALARLKEYYQVWKPTGEFAEALVIAIDALNERVLRLRKQAIEDARKVVK
jgi:hypothetical protein